jgi:hypothetical protein
MTIPSWYSGVHGGENNRRKFSKSTGKKRGNPEHKLQVSLMDYLAIAARPEIHYFAIPNQSNRHIANAAKMKAEGVRAGTPDLCFMLPGGRVGWLEMKSPDGTLSSAQKWFRDLCGRLGHHWAMARSVDEAAGVLAAWGALKDQFTGPKAELPTQGEAA